MQGTRKSDGRNMTVRSCSYEDYGNSCNGIKVLNFDGQVRKNKSQYLPRGAKKHIDTAK